jgi:hypothetical protein
MRTIASRQNAAYQYAVEEHPDLWCSSREWMGMVA